MSQKQQNKKAPTGIGAKGPTQTAAKLSASKAAKSALERIGELEGQFYNLSFGTAQGFEGVQQDMSAHSEFIEAVVDLVGKEKVEERMKSNRVKRATEKMEQMRSKLDQAVADEIMLPIVAVTPTCLVVGTQKDGKGEVIPPGRAQVAFSEFAPDVAKLFEGKEVGTVVELPNGTSFKITALYDPNPNPPKKEEAPSTESAPAAQ